MEYAVSVVIVLLFLLLSVLTKNKFRYVHYDVYKEKEFCKEADKFITKQPLPKKGGGVTATPKYTSAVNAAFRKFNAHRLKEKFLLNKKPQESNVSYENSTFPDTENMASCGDAISQYNCSSSVIETLNKLFINNKKAVKKLQKTDFSVLETLPAINSEARIVTLSRFILGHSGYIFSHDRVKSVFDAQNKNKSLTSDEINALSKAFKYVYYEKLAALCIDVITLTKLEKTADNIIKKYCSKNRVLSDTENKRYLLSKRERAFYKTFSDNGVFSYTKYDNAYKNGVGSIILNFNSILEGLKSLELYDYFSFYKPLDLLNEYPAFKKASIIERKNFIAVIKVFSDKENIDEYYYTERLNNYVKANPNIMLEGKRYMLLKSLIVAFKVKRNIKLLAHALSNDEIMRLYFGKNKTVKDKIKEKYYKKAAI